MKKKLLLLGGVLVAMIALAGCGAVEEESLTKPIISKESLEAAKKYNIDLKELDPDSDVIVAKDEEGLTIKIHYQNLIESDTKDAKVKALIEYFKSVADEKKFEFMLGGDEDGVLFVWNNWTFRMKINGTTYSVLITDITVYSLTGENMSMLEYDGTLYQDGFVITLKKE